MHSSGSTWRSLQAEGCCVHGRNPSGAQGRFLWQENSPHSLYSSRAGCHCAHGGNPQVTGRMIGGSIFPGLEPSWGSGRAPALGALTSLLCTAEFQEGFCQERMPPYLFPPLMPPLQPKPFKEQFGFYRHGHLGVV